MTETSGRSIATSHDYPIITGEDTKPIAATCPGKQDQDNSKLKIFEIKWKLDLQ